LRGRFGDPDIDLLVPDLHLKMIGFDFAIVHPSSIVECKPPSVPGACDTSFVYPTGRKRCPLMWAKVVQCVEATFRLKDRNHSVPDWKCTPFILGYLAGL
jgi:hypothetical protein